MCNLCNNQAINRNHSIRYEQSSPNYLIRNGTQQQSYNLKNQQQPLYIHQTGPQMFPQPTQFHNPQHSYVYQATEKKYKKLKNINQIHYGHERLQQYDLYQNIESPNSDQTYENLYPRKDINYKAEFKHGKMRVTGLLYY